MMEGRCQEWERKFGMRYKLFATGKAECLQFVTKYTCHYACGDHDRETFQHECATDHEQKPLIAREDRDHSQDAAQAERSTISHDQFGTTFGGSMTCCPR